MELELKDDWAVARERLEAWWHREALDRAVVRVTARRAGWERWEPAKPASLEQQWTDVQWILDQAVESMRATYYGGEAFPCYCPNVGPDVFAGYLGCPIQFAEGTSWSSPIIEDWSQVGRMRIDRDNRWWKLVIQMIEAALEISRGRFIVGVTDLHGGMDAISAMRGPQRLCLDLIESPRQVLRAMYELIPLWYEVFEAQHEPIRRADPEYGCTSWIGTWSKGRSYPVSCDFMCMISPEMMREYVMPDLISEVNWLDHSIFHLDGQGALHNLDLLLEMDRLDAIQWVPGDGNWEARRWLPVLKRIQAAGRAVQYNCTPEEALFLARELSPNGLMLCTSCDTEAEARGLVNQIAELTRPPKVFQGGSTAGSPGDQLPNQ